MPGSLKKLIRNIYVLILMAFTVWYGQFMYPLIFGFEEKEAAAAVSLREMLGTENNDELFFENLVATPDEEMILIDLGYKVVEQPYVEGHYHHTGFSIQSDKVSICVVCHGAVPHDASKETRSFLNMHTFYIGCETCHLYPPEGEPALEFRWYDKLSGVVVPNPVDLVEIENTFRSMDDFEKKYVSYGNYGAKISPGKAEEGEFEFLKRGNMMAYVTGFIEHLTELNESQQSQVKNIIHRDVNEEHLQCEACHNNTEPYLPLAELGYPPRRVEELTNTAVVGMIKKYEEFWIPNLIK